MRYFLYCFGLPFNTAKFEISNNYMVGQTMKTHSESIETLIDTITETSSGGYDFDSENDGSVTVRHRDSMEQERVKISDLKEYLRKRLEF